MKSCIHLPNCGVQSEFITIYFHHYSYISFSLCQPRFWSKSSYSEMIFFLTMYLCFHLFSIVVDPSKLSTGLHYYEVCGIDCKSPWRGPLFRIPITITKPAAVLNLPPVVSFSKMSFEPGQIILCFFNTVNACFSFILFSTLRSSSSKD